VHLFSLDITYNYKKIKRLLRREDIGMKEPRRNETHNASGCLDLTAYNATHKYDEYVRFENCLHTLFAVCDDLGFKIDGRVVLIDQITGKVWR